MQSIVYKLVADLEKNEVERQCKFYREKNLEFPPQLKEKLEKNALFSYLKENNNNNNDEKPIETTSASSSTNNNETPAPSSTASNSSTSNSQNNDYHRNDEQVALSLEPLDGLKVNLILFILSSELYFNLKF